MAILGFFLIAVAVIAYYCAELPVRLLQLVLVSLKRRLNPVRLETEDEKRSKALAQEGDALFRDLR